MQLYIYSAIVTRIYALLSLLLELMPCYPCEFVTITYALLSL